MIKKKKEGSGPIEVDLTGPDGNAFVLMGMASKWAKQLSIPFEPIRKEMMAGDYEHLLETLDNHFGKYVTFYR